MKVTIPLKYAFTMVVAGVIGFGIGQMKNADRISELESERHDRLLEMVQSEDAEVRQLGMQYLGETMPEVAEAYADVQANIDCLEAEGRSARDVSAITLAQPGAACK